MRPASRRTQAGTAGQAFTGAARADAVSAEVFDAAKAAEGGALRVKGAERLRAAVIQALGKIHALLDADQRTRLAYLILTGVMSL